MVGLGATVSPGVTGVELGVGEGVTVGGGVEVAEAAGGLEVCVGWAEPVVWLACSLAVAVIVGPDESDPSMGTTLVLVGGAAPDVCPEGDMSDASEVAAVSVGPEAEACSSANLSVTSGRVS